MELSIGTESYIFNNELAAVEHIYSFIENRLKELESVLVSVEYDDYVVEEDFKTYLASNIERINKVVVNYKSYQVLVKETKASLHNYLDQALLLLPELAELFYQGGSQSAWAQLSDLIEGIQWIQQVSNSFETLLDEEETANLRNAVNRLSQVVAESFSAVTHSDTLSLGDLINYELVPAFEQIKNLI